MSKELLFSVKRGDFHIATFRSGGKGGQNQNKRDTGVRITHKESGAVGESRDRRTQGENKKAAFLRLLDSTKWRVWFNLKVLESTLDSTVDSVVDDQMKPENLKVEAWWGDGWKVLK